MGVTDDGTRTTTRRAVLAGAGAVGVAVTAAACGSSDSSGPSGSAGGAGGGGPIKTADIPVGGGKIYGSQDVVVTQPVAGTFKAFSATCTHQGCILASVRDGTINCGCHGSQYSIQDGSVKQAATGMTVQTQKPLPAKTATVSGDTITVS